MNIRILLISFIALISTFANAEQTIISSRPETDIVIKRRTSGGVVEDIARFKGDGNGIDLFGKINASATSVQHNLNSSGTSAQFILGRNQVGSYGWAYFGADDVNAFRIWSGGTGSGPSLGTSLYTLSQEGAFVAGPSGATTNLHSVNGGTTFYKSTGGTLILAQDNTGSSGSIALANSGSGGLRIWDHGFSNKLASVTSDGAWTFGPSSFTGNHTINGPAVVFNNETSISILRIASSEGFLRLVAGTGSSSGGRIDLTGETSSGLGKIIFYSNNTEVMNISPAGALTAGPASGLLSGHKIQAGPTGNFALTVENYSTSAGSAGLDVIINSSSTNRIFRARTTGLTALEALYDGDVNIYGYTALGDGNTPMKCDLLPITTINSSATGTVAHGLTLSRIISVTGVYYISTVRYALRGTYSDTSLSAGYISSIDSTNISVYNGTSQTMTNIDLMICYVQ